ncbi:MAG: hypothetical protein KF773_05105 [Deltaproteobacteria bacterium]|nr:hypothetical protein [Deltaproteobacteria bacterium]
MTTTTTKREARPGLLGALVHALRPRRRETLSAAVTINRPRPEVFLALQHLDQLSSFMGGAVIVRSSGPRRLTWTLELPTSAQAEWELELVEERPSEKLAWRATERSALPIDVHVALVQAPGRDATELHARLVLGRARLLPTGAAKLFEKDKLKDDLRRLKQILETGEVLHSDASIHRGRHPAMPPGEVHHGALR